MSGHQSTVYSLFPKLNVAIIVSGRKRLSFTLAAAPECHNMMLLLLLRIAQLVANVVIVDSRQWLKPLPELRKGAEAHQKAQQAEQAATAQKYFVQIVRVYGC